jgi:hypothetical protein
MRIQLLAVGIIAAACLRSGEEAHAQTSEITPADWDRVAGRYRPCAPASVPNDSAAYVTWTLARPRGARLSLPALLREVPSPERGARRWMAADSSRLELRMLSEPVGAMAVGGSVQFEREGECALPVAGYRALVTRIRVTDARTKRRSYAAAVDAFVRPGIAFSAWIESPVAATRDAVVGAFGTLAIPTARGKAPGA